MNRKLFALLGLVALCLCACSTSVNQSHQQQTPLAHAPEILTGQLDNGLTYIIQKHGKSSEPVTFMLTVKVGREDEQLNEQGNAHFIEHLVANGSLAIAGRSLADYLNSQGLVGHKNATTNTYQTNYFIKLPPDDPELLSKGYDVLQDWASRINLADEEVERERNIILEEYRLRYDSVKGRSLEERISHLRQGTRYGKRTLTELNRVTETVTKAELEQFHRHWYRPDLMAVTVVGDIDPQQVLVELKSHLEPLQQPASPAPENHFKQPDNATAEVLRFFDSDLDKTSFTLRKSHPTHGHQSLEDRKICLNEELFARVLQARLNTLPQKAGFSNLKASAKSGSFYADKSALTLKSETEPEHFEQAYLAVLTELYRLQQHGIGEKELSEAKAWLIKERQKQLKVEGRLSSYKLAQRHAARFAKEHVLLSAQQELELANNILAELNSQQVMAHAQQLFTDNNRFISVEAPKKIAHAIPSDSRLAEIWQQASKQPLAAFEKTEPLPPLMAQLPQPGAVVKKEYFAEYDAHLWTLSNGAEVILKPTPFRQGRILFHAKSRGGYSLVDDDTYRKIIGVDNYVNKLGGVADYSEAELEQLNAGKDLRLMIRFNQEYEKMVGYTASDDLDHFLQLLHLKMTAPIKDEVALNKLVQNRKVQAAMLSDSPSWQYKIAKEQAIYADAPRSLLTAGQRLETFDSKLALEFYRQQLANAADFRFVFVGDFELSEMEQKLNLYLASMSGNPNQRDKSKPEPKVYAKGLIEVNHVLEKGNKASTELRLFGESEFSDDKRLELNVLAKILQLDLHQRLREELQGSYAIKVKSNFKESSNRYALTINFTSKPERQEELIQAIDKILETYQQKGPSEEMLSNVQQKLLRSLDTRSHTNVFWLTKLTKLGQKELTGVDVERRQKMISSLTREQLQRAARLYFSPQGKVVAKLKPAESRLAALD